MFDAHWIDQDGIQALTKLMKTTYLSCFLYNVMLKSKKKAVKEIKNCLETKRQELVRFDDKIRASQQNRGHLSACGNCHLKLGHSRKICTFSPCKSAFSCGILSKHSSKKNRKIKFRKRNQPPRMKTMNGSKRCGKYRSCGRQSDQLEFQTNRGCYYQWNARQVHFPWAKKLGFFE